MKSCMALMSLVLCLIFVQAPHAEAGEAKAGANPVTSVAMNELETDRRGIPALGITIEQLAQAYVCPYARAYDRCVARCFNGSVRGYEARRRCSFRCRPIRDKCRRPSRRRRGTIRSRGI